jgi:hypothetical protein
MKRLFAVVLAALAGCSCERGETTGGERAGAQMIQDGNEKIKDGPQMYNYFVKNATWCGLRLDSTEFVTRSNYLEKALRKFGSKLEESPTKTWQDIMWGTTSCKVAFYSVRNTERSEIGMIAFTNRGGTEKKRVSPCLFLMKGTDRAFPGLTKVKKGNGGYLDSAQEDNIAFLNEVQAVVENIDIALDSLSVENTWLWSSAVDSLCQKCFQHEGKKIIPKLEPFLQDKDKWKKQWAARAILKITPSHNEAKKISDAKER